MRKIKIVAILMALSFFGASYASAQENAPGDSSLITLATVNIYKAKVVSQKDNNLAIAFDISNGEGIQPGVRYSVVLVSGEGNNQTVSDEKVYAEKLVLGSNETVHKEIAYTAPGYLKGDFNVWVLSDNDKGLPLTQGLAGKITLNGSGQFVNILPSSCFLKIEGEINKKYTLTQGVDVAPAENLILVCNVQNNFSNLVTATPNFNTFYRVTSGDLVASAKQASFSLAAGEKKTLEFSIPKASKPQAYDATLSLLDDKNAAISNNVTVHYVLQGNSATIQNLNLDKDSYIQGESAQVTFSWSGRADSFSGSRQRQNDLSLANNTVALTISSGSSACSDVFKQELTYDNMVNVALAVPIKTDCPDPKVSFILQDKDNNVLDKADYSLNDEKDGMLAPQTTASSNSNALKRNSIILVVILLAISLALILVYKKRRNSVAMFLALAILSGAFFSLGARQVQADTFTSYTKCATKITTTNTWGITITVPTGWTNAVYAVSLDNPNYVTGDRMTYNDGDPMVITGRTKGIAECDNGDQAAGVDGYYSKISPNYPDQLTKSDFNLFHWVSDDGGSLSGSKTRTVETTAGSYYISFVGLVYGPPHNSAVGTPGTTICDGSVSQGWNYRDHYEIPYTVVTTPPPGCIPDSACASHPVTWSGYCSGICDGGLGTESGTCSDGCLGTGHTTRSCTNDTPCPVIKRYGCVAGCAGANCCKEDTNGKFTDPNCNNSCSSTGDWREVAP
jgi:hypothetical protein